MIEETQQEYIERLIERETHGDTMRNLSPLEKQHLIDWRSHFELAWRVTQDD